MIALPFARDAKLIQLGLLELSFLASFFCGQFVLVRGECSGYCKRKADFDCYTDAAAGGCCNSTARPAHMIYDGDKCEKLLCNNAWHWQCDGSCHEDSACQGAKRIDDGAAACSAKNCVGGCLRDGRCEHHFVRDQERACLMSNPDAIWCPPCDILLWKSCAAAVPCYDWPFGCCSAESGGCPAPPYEMRRARECGACAFVSRQCDACFPDSICSSHFDPSFPAPKNPTVAGDEVCSGGATSTTAVAATLSIAAVTRDAATGSASVGTSAYASRDVTFTGRAATTATVSLRNAPCNTSLAARASGTVRGSSSSSSGTSASAFQDATSTGRAATTSEFFLRTDSYKTSLAPRASGSVRGGASSISSNITSSTHFEESFSSAASVMQLLAPAAASQIIVACALLWFVAP